MEAKNLADNTIAQIDHQTPILTLKSVTKEYKTAAGGFLAIHSIDLEVYTGEFLGIIGKSGAGKTTLLNMITGVSEITSGEVIFYPPGDPARQPISIHEMDEDQMALWRGRNIGIIYQSFELMPMLNLVDNVMLPLDFTGSYRPGISREYALELLEMVDLSEHAYKVPANISGGQKQRVAIARALASDPPVIVADEPTGSLDSITAETILKIFEDLVAQGKTIIMVTHDRNMASRFSRRVLISDGEILEKSQYEG